ncbi:MAG: hypothetical protein QF489_04795 [Planctomycetota bacterium]|jgi:hypothetical protein|nr:hypothetical protein [Planctomycetota bacterium]
MSKKDLEIKCPDCGSRLRIDRETGGIIAHGREDKAKDLADVKARMEGKTQAKRDAFGAALKAERGRKNELDSLFKDAAEKASKNEEEEPDNPLDERWR